MAELIVKLKFVNRDASPEVEEMRVEQSAVSRIMDWYGAFFAGDDYDVYVNDRLQHLGINGELELVTIDGNASDVRADRYKLLKNHGGSA